MRFRWFMPAFRWFMLRLRWFMRASANYASPGYIYCAGCKYSPDSVMSGLQVEPAPERNRFFRWVPSKFYGGVSELLNA